MLFCTSLSCIWWSWLKALEFKNLPWALTHEDVRLNWFPAYYSILNVFLVFNIAHLFSKLNPRYFWYVYLCICIHIRKTLLKQTTPLPLPVMFWLALQSSLLPLETVGCSTLKIHSCNLYFLNVDMALVSHPRISMGFMNKYNCVWDIDILLL